ncbi:hypothetical protein F5B20DRAFT_363520 [Whalleya microplaca]|nr:hypothetical protein F5B20DRAFT_363520 [Whalleya microplaca]
MAEQPNTDSTTEQQPSASLPTKYAPIEARRFPRFAFLPPELRLMIWGFALPTDIPEVHILTFPDEISSVTQDLPKVDTGYPRLMHVCREACYFAKAHTTLRYSSVAGCEVACRDFQPDLDILHITAHDLRLLSRQIETYKDFAAKIQNLSVFGGFMFSGFIQTLNFLKNLQTLHITFGAPISLCFNCGDSTDSSISHLRPTLPRYAVRPFTKEEQDKLNRYQRRNYISISRLHYFIQAGIPDWGGTFDIKAWDRETRTLKLQIVPQILLYFHRSADGQACWSEKRVKK